MRALFFCLILIRLEAYEFSICSFFQDEGPYLQEWIEYHRLIGFEHFWLYNNNSSDNYKEVLQPYVDSNIVELYDWPSPPGEFWAAYQVMAFNDGIKRAAKQSTWLAMIDVDEFIVPEYGVDDFKQRMREFEKNDRLGGLILFWQIFGTSNIWDIAEGKTLIESLTHCAKMTFSMNNIVKTIVRPARVAFFDIHSGAYKEGFVPFTLEGPVAQKEISFQEPIHSPIRINHYWVRTLNWFYEKKIPRLRMFNQSKFTPGESESLNHELNQHEDHQILQYLPGLKEKLNIN